MWGKKIIVRGWKRGRNAYFFLNWLKIYKITKRRLNFFFEKLKKYKSGGGGGARISNFIYTPVEKSDLDSEPEADPYLNLDQN